MKKSTKGAIAAGAAGVLLLGGAGTLAYWTAEGDVTGIDVQAGELAIINDSCADADWVFDGDEDEADKVYEAGDLIVPGDTLSKECSFEIQATGEHLRATVDVTNPTLGGDLAASLDYTGSFQIDAVDVTDGEITEANDGDVVDATLSVTFDPNADNTTQTLSASLTDFSVLLEQIHD